MNQLPNLPFSDSIHGKPIIFYKIKYKNGRTSDICSSEMYNDTAKICQEIFNTWNTVYQLNGIINRLGIGDSIIFCDKKDDEIETWQCTAMGWIKVDNLIQSV